MRRSSAPPVRRAEPSLGGSFSIRRRPRAVQYRGARYVLAQDDIEVGDEDATQMVVDLARGVKTHAEGLLQQAGIQFSAQPGIASSGEGDRKDGFELKYNLQSGNFSGLEADLYLDYLVKGKNALGEPASWWESLVSIYRNKEDVENLGGTYNLNQMVFRFCKGNHAASTDKSPKLPQMLETIAFLQGAGGLVTVKAERDEGKTISEEAGEASDQVIKAMFALKNHFQGKSFKKDGLNKGENYPADRDEKWSDVATWEGLLTELGNKGLYGIQKPLADSLLTAIKQLATDNALATTIRNLEKLAKKPPAAKTMEGPGGVRDLMKTKLANIINRGPYRINYTAWDRMAISGDSQGNTILKIAAPMRPYFTFKKEAGGAPALVEASCLLCGRIFSSAPGDEAAAGKLAWTGVVLGRGAALGTNPVETEHLIEETWLVDLKNQLPAADKIEEKTTEQVTPQVTPKVETKPGEEAVPTAPPQAEQPARARGK